MIKFFRKIRQQLLQENRFSKYLLYAIGEIVLVVIGILIALQINNWNENRKTLTKEQSYIIRLLSENKEDLNSFNTIISDLEKGKESIVKMSTAFNLKDTDDTTLIARVNTFFLYGSLYPNFAPSTSTYEDLASTGNLDIIKNIDLRDRIVKHYTRCNQVVERIKTNKQWGLSVDAPFHYSKSIMQLEPSTAFLYGTPNDQLLANRLRKAKQEYIDNAAVHYWINEDTINDLELLIQESKQIIALLEQELTS